MNPSVLLHGADVTAISWTAAESKDEGDVLSKTMIVPAGPPLQGRLYLSPRRKVPAVENRCSASVKKSNKGVAGTEAH